MTIDSIFQMKEIKIIENDNIFTFSYERSENTRKWQYIQLFKWWK